MVRAVDLINEAMATSESPRYRDQLLLAEFLKVTISQMYNA